MGCVLHVWGRSTGLRVEGQCGSGGLVCVGGGVQVPLVRGELVLCELASMWMLTLGPGWA
jgi:hypothetical protein